MNTFDYGIYYFDFSTMDRFTIEMKSRAKIVGLSTGRCGDLGIKVMQPVRKDVAKEMRTFQLLERSKGKLSLADNEDAVLTCTFEYFDLGLDKAPVYDLWEIVPAGTNS
jgi:hypothetical protein